jgi:glycosyltransferase involved in cell wall biosynthesis
MKVLVITNMFPTEREPGNGSFVSDQVDDLRELGVDVEVLAFDGRHAKTEYARAAHRLRRVTATGAFDLVHAHYGLTGAVALAQRKAPVVTTFHGSDTGYVRWQGQVSWLVARATVPIFVSRRGALALGLAEAAVIPAGVDTATFAPMERAEARRRLGWRDDARYVLFPGSRRNPRKCWQLFQRAFMIESARNPDLEAVALEGFDRSEVVLVMNAVSAVLMTSEFEGSPVAIKEALACRTPVVAVDVGDIPEMLAGLPGCAVCSREPARLADALHAVLQDADGKALRDRAMVYDRGVIARRVLDLYEQCLSRSDGDG